MQVRNGTEIRLAYMKVRQLFPESDHIMMAYKLKDHMGWQDDSEHGAGVKLQQMLIDNSSMNTVLFVTRKTAGLHLGPHRFMYIQRVAKDALARLAAVI